MKIREMIENAKSKLFHRDGAGKNVPQSVKNGQEDAKNRKTGSYPSDTKKGQEGALNDGEEQEKVTMIYKTWNGEKAETTIYVKKANTEDAAAGIMKCPMPEMPEEGKHEYKFEPWKPQERTQSGAERQSIQNMCTQGKSSSYERWSETQRLKNTIAKQNFFNTMDRAQQLKFQMPNNERRRRGIPMVRRRAYLQAEKNERRRARKK